MSDIMKCWNCADEFSVNEIICGRCNTPQQPYFLDSFSLFGIQSKFDLDWQQVEERYFFLLKKCHPDRFVTADSEVKSYAQNWASQLNQAYQILKDPLSRAEALLKIFNVPINDKEEQEILIEVFGWREVILERNERELGLLKKELFNVKEQCLKNILQAFNQSEYLKVPSLLKRLSYAQKCLNEIP